MKLHVIRTEQDPLIELIKDDPVRPSIPRAARVHDHAEILVAKDLDDSVGAIVCVAYLDQIPTTEGELGAVGNNVAAFYTIWSYKSGFARELIMMARDYIQATRPEIKTFITLSPKTEMARKFHLNNGATVYQENSDTINYQYS
jgi:hypothetical protein